MRKLKPFFHYFGSKHRIAATRYPAPTYDTIIEPFCGSAAYACAYPDRQVILCDADPRVILIWRYLIAASPERIMRLPLLEPGQHLDTLRLKPAPALLISCCVNTSPFRSYLSSFSLGHTKADGTLNASGWGPALRERIASQVDRIKHWRAYWATYDRSGDYAATRFIDPPYEGLQQQYEASAKNPIDYPRLAAWCRSRRGQTIVCERPTATWLPFRSIGEFPTHAAGKTSPEGVWIQEA